MLTHWLVGNTYIQNYINGNIGGTNLYSWVAK